MADLRRVPVLLPVHRHVAQSHVTVIIDYAINRISELLIEQFYAYPSVGLTRVVEKVDLNEGSSKQGKALE